MILNTQNTFIPSTFRGNQTKDLKIATKRQNVTSGGVNFTGIPEALAAKVPEAVLKNGLFHSILNLAERNASLFDASFLLVIATTLRPVSVMAVPGAEIEDKKYAAVKAITSGLISFALACIIYIPLGRFMQRFGNRAKIADEANKLLSEAMKATSKSGQMAKANEAAETLLQSGHFFKPEQIEKVFKHATKALTEKTPEATIKAAQQGLNELTKVAKFPYRLGSKEYDSFNYMLNYGSKFLIGPFTAFMLFKSIPPMMKKVFPDRHKKGKFDPPPTFAKQLNNNQQRLTDEFIAKLRKGVQA